MERSPQWVEADFPAYSAELCGRFSDVPYNLKWREIHNLNRDKCCVLFSCHSQKAARQKDWEIRLNPRHIRFSVTPVVPSFEWLSVLTKPLHIKMKTCQCFRSFWGEMLFSFTRLHGVFVHICFAFYISLDRNKTFHEKCILTTSAGPG